MESDLFKRQRCLKSFLNRRLDDYQLKDNPSEDVEVNLPRKMILGGLDKMEKKIKKIQHAMLDEMSEEIKKEWHRMLDDAYKSGAMPESWYDADSYLAPKAIVQVWCKKNPYSPPSLNVVYKRDVANLAHFI